MRYAAMVLMRQLAKLEEHMEEVDRASERHQCSCWSGDGRDTCVRQIKDIEEAIVELGGMRA